MIVNHHFLNIVLRFAKSSDFELINSFKAAPKLRDFGEQGGFHSHFICKLVPQKK